MNAPELDSHKTGVPQLQQVAILETVSKMCSEEFC
jgi:hypothetical protein